MIYSLNTRNDDLESDLDNTRAAYEERLQICQQQLELMSSTVSKESIAHQGHPSIGNNSSDLIDRLGIPSSIFLLNFVCGILTPNSSNQYAFKSFIYISEGRANYFI